MRTLFRHLAPWAALALALMAAADPTSAALGALQGAGWVSSIACVTCLGAGVALIGSGWGAITTFIWSSGSAYAAATCLAACADAVM